MKIRNRKVTVRLTEAERQHLISQAEIAGLKIEPFLRDMIMGKQLVSRPKEEWAELIYQISAIGNNVNQIARNTNSGEPVTRDLLKTISEMQLQIWQKVKEL